MMECVLETSVDNHTSAIIDVCEGESKDANENTMLGSFILHDIPAAPKGVKDTPQFGRGSSKKSKGSGSDSPRSKWVTRDMIKTSKCGDKVLNPQSLCEFNRTTGIHVLNKVSVVKDKDGEDKAPIVVKDKAAIVVDKPINVVKDKADVLKGPVAKEKNNADVVKDKPTNVVNDKANVVKAVVAKGKDKANVEKAPVAKDKDKANVKKAMIAKDKDKADVVKDKRTNVVKDKADMVKVAVTKGKDKADVVNAPIAKDKENANVVKAPVAKDKDKDKAPVTKDKENADVVKAPVSMDKDKDFFI
ncbi:ribonuclease H-like domain-containing protein [Tanacetum coccineum]|uniref:Ribonuclease H-like domain-containing protein n=1 Tax=Tanacetum coccineum TaxID=301880 RepID=A0ABQ5IQ16_9ASTR